MSNIWFTSDIHFGHRNILAYCPNRPFKTIEEHDEAILAEWREKVRPGDDIYFLGDLCLYGHMADEPTNILSKLTGNVHIVLGNHDRALKQLRKWRRSGTMDGFRHIHFMEPSERVDGFYRFKMDGISCVLTHHPLEDWPGIAAHGRYPLPDVDPLSGRWHLHGHSHGASRRMPGRLDVGWDTENRILSWDDVKRIMRERA